MLEIVIPGDTTLGLQHLVLDYNGTLACDGAIADIVPANRRGPPMGFSMPLTGYSGSIYNRKEHPVPSTGGQL
jgi:hypothetical protein